MSSSYLLGKRIEEGWNFGPMWDHYIANHKACHPDFSAIPIGHAGGVKVCVRKPASTEELKAISRPKTPRERKAINAERAAANGATFRSFRLYTPRLTPVEKALGETVARPPQLTNPYPLESRYGNSTSDWVEPVDIRGKTPVKVNPLLGAHPTELEMIARQYKRLPTWFNGTGMERTPSRAFPVDFFPSVAFGYSGEGKPILSGRETTPSGGPRPTGGSTLANALTRGIPLEAFGAPPSSAPGAVYPVTRGTSLGCRSAPAPFG